MKIEDLERHVLVESILNSSVSFEELESGFEQLERLSEAMNSGNFGGLVSKQPGAKLTNRDIIQIKRELRDILENNPVLSFNTLPVGRDGNQRLRLLTRRLSHGMSALSMAALTGFLGGKSIAVALGTGGLAIPISVALGGGALITGRVTKKQADTVRALNATSHLLDLMNTYGDVKKAGNRGTVKRIFDWLTNKTPAEIERETQKRITQATRDAERRMQQLTRRLPKEINYINNRGEEVSMPIEELFNV